MKSMTGLRTAKYALSVARVEQMLMIGMAVSALNVTKSATVTTNGMTVNAPCVARLAMKWIRFMIGFRTVKDVVNVAESAVKIMIFLRIVKNAVSAAKYSMICTIGWMIVENVLGAARPVRVSINGMAASAPYVARLATVRINGMAANALCVARFAMKDMTGRMTARDALSALRLVM
jgi:hypothetical protein